jgi:hypothetical protein
MVLFSDRLVDHSSILPDATTPKGGEDLVLSIFIIVKTMIMMTMRTGDVTPCVISFPKVAYIVGHASVAGMSVAVCCIARPFIVRGRRIY